MKKGTSLPFRATFFKDPLTISFDLNSLKDGDYLIEGESTGKRWDVLMKDISAASGGMIKARLEMGRRGRQMSMVGQAEVELMRQCSRTLEIFPDVFHFSIDEKMTIGTGLPESEQQETEQLGDVLDVADYLRQHILLNMDPYPVKPELVNLQARGSVLVSDGLTEDDLLEEKAATKGKRDVAETHNPFAVLEKLKKKSS